VTAMEGEPTKRAQHGGRKARKRRRHHVGANRPPVGSTPGTLAPGALDGTTRIRAVRYSPDGCEEREIRQLDELATFCKPEAFLWVDVQGLGDHAALAALGQHFHLHPLVLSDVVHVPQRPKSESYPGSIFTVARRLRWKGEAGDLVDERQVSLVLGERHVLSFQEGADDVFEPVRKRLLHGGGRIRGLGSDYLAYALLDAIVDEYLPLMDRLGEALEHIEERVIECPTRALLSELACLKGDLIAIRRDIWPQREALHGLMRGDVGAISTEVQPYLRDVHDHCVQVAEVLEVYREIAASVMNLYLTSIANRTNEVMKVLTVVSTIFIPLTFLVGVYGMNFHHMPEYEWRWAYPVLWLLMLGGSVAMVLAFRRRGWLGRGPE